MTRLERLRRAVEKLPGPAREVYWLSAVEGLDYAVISARLGIGMAEVEAALAEAIVALDRLLDEAGS